MAEYAGGTFEPIEVNRRALPDRLRYFARQLDEKGDQQIIRYAVASGLIAVATELELRIDGSDG